MKKTFVFLTVVITLLGIFLTAAPYVLGLLGIEDPVKRYIVNKVFNEKGHHLSLKNMNLGVGKIIFDGISFHSADEKVELLVGEVVVDYNLFNLISTPTEPKEAIQQIYINAPRLLFHSKQDSNKIAGQNNTAQEDSLSFDGVVEILHSLDALNKLRIDEGKIIFEDASGTYNAITGGLNGWVSSLDSNRLNINVSGNLFSSDENNFSINLDFHKQSGAYQSQVEIKEYRIQPDLIKLFTDEIYLSGHLAARLKIDGNIKLLDSTVTQVDGFIHANGFDIFYDGVEVSNAQFNAEIEDGKLKVEEGQFLLTEQPVSFNLNIPNVLNPRIHGTLLAQNFDLSNTQTLLKREIVQGGRLNLNLKYDISPQNRNISGKLSSSNLIIYDQEVEKLSSTFFLKDQQVQFKRIDALFSDVRVAGSAFYNLNSKILSISSNNFYKAGKHQFFDKLSLAEHHLSSAVQFNFKTEKIKGWWDYKINSQKDTLLALKGQIEQQGKTLLAKVSNSNHAGLQASLTMDDYLSNPQIRDLQIENFPFKNFSTDKLYNNVLEKVQTKISLLGKIDDLRGSILIKNKAEKDTAFVFSSRIRDLFSPKTRINGSVSFLNMKGDYHTAITEDAFYGTFKFMEGLRGHLDLNLAKEENQIDGLISLDQFKVNHAWNSSTDLFDYRNLGELNGALKVNGTLKDPKLSASLEGNKFVFNDMGYFSNRLKLRLDKRALFVDTLNIYLNNAPILEANGTWSLLTNNISGNLHGEEVEASNIAKAFAVTDSFLTGTAQYDIALKGDLDNPYIESEFLFEKGKIDGIPFDELELNLLDKVQDQGDPFTFKDHLLELQKLYIARKGHYHFNSVGTFPLNSTENVDLAVNFDGDILGLLNHWEPFFLDGASLADISLKFKGKSNKVSLVAADILLERGELWLDSVAPHVKDITAEIKLEEGSNQVNIINLTAFVENNFLRIKTVRNIETSTGRKIKPWYFKGIDLDFGVLALETSGEGVNLNIPGVMEKNEFGHLNLLGKTEGERFYFAGPVRHPLAYGKLQINDTRLTYPFIGSGKVRSKPTAAEEFLSKMEWDVELYPGEDVIYHREIPAYIDNVLAEITVDDNSPGLHFTGIINKGTFKPIGSLLSTRGRIEYLDQNFKVDIFKLDFNQYKDMPDVSGRAWTTIRDSVGAVPKTIYLQLYTFDSNTGEEKVSGDWNDFKFKLVSADPVEGETQEQVLAYLGYSVGNIENKVSKVGGAITEKILIRPLLRPLEKMIENSLGVDLVRFNTNIARNLFLSNFERQTNQNSAASPFFNRLNSEDNRYLYLMSSSEVTVGKYLWQDLYLTYTGQLVSVYENTQTGFDFNHSLGVEYKLFNSMLVQFEWDRELLGYYNYANQRQYLEDFKIRLRQSISF